MAYADDSPRTGDTLARMKRFLVQPRGFEAVAHVASWIAMTLTLVMVGIHEESNPVARALMDLLGKHGYVLLTPVLITILYRLLHWYGSRRFAAIPAIALSLDALGNVVTVVGLGLPETFRVTPIVTTSAAVFALAVVCYTRTDRRIVAAIEDRLLPGPLRSPDR
ncbi:hypothetical protein [Halomicrobium salinisoli]|uniref:hypothetical protein n=1 Tax=Halomicrobium salinisoli TaxID=2878391 RepID=UPI001CF0382C|nr:hypothetical protein [Halomicrobium salinisoli]